MNNVINDKNLKNETDHNKRLEILNEELYHYTFLRFSKSLKVEDKLVFSLKILQVRGDKNIEN